MVLVMRAFEEETHHLPVLLKETLTALAPQAGGRYLDGTLGLGGHCAAIAATASDSEICALDRDAQALAIAKDRLSAVGERVHFFQYRYSRFAEALAQLQWDRVDGALLDIGVSSLQIDNAARGFTFYGNGPLDMRMDRDSGAPSAWHWVNRESYARLKQCIATLGEDPQAGRIARFIVEARQKSPIETTEELAALVEAAYPHAWRVKARHHPATRTFQALRMAVNNELEELKMFLDQIFAYLSPGGRLVVITFHSLEDRFVKQAARHWAEGCRCPRHIPVCVCDHQPEARILYKKPVRAGHAEVAANPRASSAKLRAVEKLAGAGHL
ncbi:MAG: 16S rRNA (cytosine(1402)-N(4))-methyltransferase RsmH [Desulfovibrio sp.]|jgi:16S rRNA (cytosine1402-N4)-methyltransferase|nr:16S rRNA (cytosine(1402)-N(4))-methyltransferase RsmH [Desulfovibrio sp.]